MSFLAAYREYCQHVTDAPSVFHEYVGLATVSAAMGNRWKLPYAGATWLYPNLWLLLVAASSRFRKSTSIRLSQHTTQLVSEIPELSWRASEEGLIKQLNDVPTGITYCDELSSFAGMLGRDFMLGGRGLWATVYDGGLPSEFFKRGQSKSRHDIALTFVAATTLEWLTDRLKESDIRGGLLPRFVLVPAYVKERSMPLPPAVDQLVQADLATRLAKIVKSSGTMVLSSQAQRLYTQWFGRWDNAKLDGTRADPWIARLATVCLKFAMIIQVDRDGQRAISREAMEEACHYATWALNAIGKLCREELVYTKFEADLKRVRDILTGTEEGADGWMDYQELLWRSHRRSHELRELVDTALESGQMERQRVTRETGRGKRLVEQVRWRSHVLEN